MKQSPQTTKLLFSTWNVRTMMTGMPTDNDLDPETTCARKTAVIDTELSKRNVHIAALQETRLAGACTIKERNFTFFWFGKPADEPRLYGTGFAVKNTIVNSIQTPVAVSDRISVMKLNTRQGTIKIISAYAPTLAAEPTVKDHFYYDLESVLDPSSDSERVVLLGDLNARVGDDHQAWPDCIGKFGVGRMNENGQRLLELCCRNNLCITNTIFPAKRHRKMTWCHPRSNSWHQLDFIIVRQKQRKEVLNTRPYHSADCDTDHSLVVSTMQLQPRPYYRQVKHSKKMNVTKTCIPALKEEYCKKLEDGLKSIDKESDPDSYWDSLRNTVHDAAVKTFGRRKRQDPDWYKSAIATIQPVLEEKRKALARLKSRPTRQAQENYRAARSTAQATVRKCVQVFWNSLCSRIEAARDSGNLKEMFAAIKTATGPTSQTCSVLKNKDRSTIDDQMEKLKRWIEHYNELYGAEGNACRQTLLNLPQSQIHNHLDDEPDIAEVLSTIESMNKGKAPGADEIPSELLQAGLIPLASHLHQLILK